jgi:hypothetical protein
MKRWLFVFPFAALSSLGATTGDVLVRFDGGIGVDPVSGIVANAPALNVVRGIPPGALPWVIKQLRAEVHTDGRIRVDGRGLLLAGGNVIGTNGGQKVVATLFCGAPGLGGSLGNATAHSSDPAGVSLAANGDFRIEDFLTPGPPAPCENAALLIATPGTPHWFAAGIPTTDDHDRDSNP